MSLSAREAWEVDRMWKGKSAAYGQSGGVTTTRISGVSTGPDPRSSIYSGYANSGQTQSSAAYLIQPGTYGIPHHGSCYAVPITSPPIPAVYAATSANYSYNAGYDPIESPLNAIRPLSNPLPEPPRQSAYSPEPFVAHNSVEDPTMTPEYWKVYAGITSH